MITESVVIVLQWTRTKFSFFLSFFFFLIFMQIEDRVLEIS